MTLQNKSRWEGTSVAWVRQTHYFSTESSGTGGHYWERDCCRHLAPSLTVGEWPTNDLQCVCGSTNSWKSNSWSFLHCPKSLHNFCSVHIFTSDLIGWEISGVAHHKRPRTQGSGVQKGRKRGIRQIIAFTISTINLLFPKACWELLENKLI